MPLAIVPVPTTPTVRTGRGAAATAAPVGVCASATTVGESGPS